MCAWYEDGGSIFVPKQQVMARTRDTSSQDRRSVSMVIQYTHATHTSTHTSTRVHCSVRQRWSSWFFFIPLFELRSVLYRPLISKIIVDLFVLVKYPKVLLQRKHGIWDSNSLHVYAFRVCGAARDSIVKTPESSSWVHPFGPHAEPQEGAEKKQNLRWRSIKAEEAEELKVMAEDSDLAMQHHTAVCSLDSIFLFLITYIVFGL